MMLTATEMMGDVKWRRRGKVAERRKGEVAWRR